MRLVPQTSPYIRKDVSVKRMMLDVIIALMPITLFAMIINGFDGIYVFMISIVTMLLGEIIAHALIKWPKDMKFKELFTKEGFKKVKDTFTINNILAPLISALIYSLILPSGLAPYVVFIGALFGIIIGKMVFGGLGCNIFNPAAVGRIFVGICFGDSLGSAYKTSRYYVDGVTSGTPLAMLKGDSLTLANTSAYSLRDLFIGAVPGSMGEVSALLILVGAVYLFARHSADLRSALSYILSFSLVVFVAVFSFYLKNDEGSLGEMFLYQLLAGGALFAAVFMITDPVTSPTSKFGRVVFGALAGCITAMVRMMGAYPEGAAFSILIVNMLAPTIDHFMLGKPNTYTWKQCLGLGVFLVVICCIVSASVVGGWF